MATNPWATPFTTTTPGGTQTAGTNFNWRPQSGAQTQYNFQNPNYSISPQEYDAITRTGNTRFQMMERYGNAWGRDYNQTLAGLNGSPNRPLWDQWRTSTERYGGAWRPTDAADITTANELTTSAAFDNWTRQGQQWARTQDPRGAAFTQFTDMNPGVIPQSAVDRARRSGNFSAINNAMAGGFRLDDGVTMPQQQTRQTTQALGFSQPQSYTPNPYLQQQASGIVGLLTDNLRNQILPGVRDSSSLNGMYGSSRQGITEGLAIQGINRDAANAIANLYSGAYEGDQNRGVQRYGIDVGAATAMRGQDRGLQGTMYSADSSRAASQYSADRGLEGTRYASDNSLAGNRYAADTSANTARYVADSNAATSRYGTDRQFQLGLANNQLQGRIADNNLELGRGNLALGNRTADNQFTLGQGNLDLQRLIAGQNYQLGLGNQEIGRMNAGTNAAQVGGQLTNNSIATATNLLNSLYQMGITDMNNPLVQMLLPYINSLVGTSTGGTQTTTRP